MQNISTGRHVDTLQKYLWRIIESNRYIWTVCIDEQWVLEDDGIDNEGIGQQRTSVVNRRHRVWQDYFGLVDQSY